ncbi:hypothetical protein VitviT2T_003088 [Vitis vinifera]|uniref:Amidase domain-containing protein n=1 Tax=Vitis vinifera TaxID=29760 RepID=A0ABY9BKU4_VITVI|nr:hypothetical protein VitviT2T_003088 [Vitis vinifera]
MTLGLCEALWLRLLLQDLGYLSKQPIRFFCDNKAACDIAHNPVQHDRTKHVEVDRFFIKEKLDDKIVKLPKIRSEDQLADNLTKVVSSQVFSKFLDKLGSYALLGAKVGGDAAVVERLRKAGAVILGKASMSEWYQFRSLKTRNGWCPRSGQGVNPYVPSGDPCESNSGSAISVAANMVAVSLGTETDGSIICPADVNSVVGFKPTIGLTSRCRGTKLRVYTGVIPISPRQDSVGPICWSVLDAVYVLDAIVGFDPRDGEATKEASKFIPVGGYKQFLNKDGIAGKRLGVVRNPFSGFYNRSTAISAFEAHLTVLRQRGAILVDNLEIENVDIILNPYESGESTALLAEFKLNINEYLKELTHSPVRSLAGIIAFNLNNSDLEKTDEYGQEVFIAAEMTNGIGKQERMAMEMMANLSQDGFEKLMMENKLDATVALGSGMATVLAIGGYPGVSVPAGYDGDGMPFGICFGGLKGMEPKLIEVAYGFEQATKIRRPPTSPNNLLCPNEPL